MSIKARSYRLFALVLALLMFSTTVGVSLDIHYCQGKVKSYGVYGKAKGCNEMTPAALSCAHRDVTDATDSGVMLGRAPCCQNGHFLFQSEQDRIATSGTGDDLRSVEMAPIPVLQFERPAETAWMQMPFRYKPPPVYRNTPVFTQRFRL